jgi:hypothetical protein
MTETIFLPATAPIELLFGNLKVGDICHISQKTGKK